MKFHAEPLVHGTATGPLLHADVGLSFWAGVNPQTGEIIDHHHPLHGRNIRDAILALPSSRGSCSGSLVLIELLLQGCAPAGLIFHETEQIITLGVIVAQALLEHSLPVIRVERDVFNVLGRYSMACISGADLYAESLPTPSPYISTLATGSTTPTTNLHLVASQIALSNSDRAFLAGDRGLAAQKAMEILLHFAHLQGARELTTVTRAHIDACIYTGPASLLIPETFLRLGARVAVPTTLNSISIDQRRWRELCIDEHFGSQADRLANTYVAMGAQQSFTCAPYLLSDAGPPPQRDESIGWAESNAVVFANSVLGARTQKYPDLIDVCIALTGRAPLVGAQTKEGRIPQLHVQVAWGEIFCRTARGELIANEYEGEEDAIYPLLGYVVGRVSGGKIPWVSGLEKVRPSVADLKAFGAAFATTASAPMFHISGVTPEAIGDVFQEGLAGSTVRIGVEEIEGAWGELTTARDPSVGLVSLGNPHFALEEFARLARICEGQKRREDVPMVITTNREVYKQACQAGYVATLNSFGAQILTDTCWCMLGEPVIAPSVRNLMTNSAKYAHYAPGMVQRGVHFGGLQACVRAAVQGFADPMPGTRQDADI